MDNLKQIRYTTENYSDMQGLRQLPLSACMALVGALTTASANEVVSGGWVLIAMIVLSIIGIGAYEWVGRRYNAIYGNVQSRKRGVPDTVWAGVAIALTFAEMLLNIPLALVMGVFGVYFIYRWRASDGWLAHYLPLGIVAFIGIAFPLVVDAPDRIAWYLLFLGVFMSIAGWFDHKALVNTLQRPPQEDE